MATASILCTEFAVWDDGRNFSGEIRRGNTSAEPACDECTTNPRRENRREVELDERISFSRSGGTKLTYLYAAI